jgi:hypothetical protein
MNPAIATTTTADALAIVRSDTELMFVGQLLNAPNVNMQLVPVKQERNLPPTIPLQIIPSAPSVPSNLLSVATLTVTDALSAHVPSTVLMPDQSLHDTTSLSQHVDSDGSSLLVVPPVDMRLEKPTGNMGLLLAQSKAPLMQAGELDKMKNVPAPPGIPARRTTEQFALTLVRDPVEHFEYVTPYGSGKLGFEPIDKTIKYATLSTHSLYSLKPASSRESFMGSGIESISFTYGVKTVSAEYGTLYFIVGSKIQLAESARLGVSPDATVMAVGFCRKGVILVLGLHNNVERVVTMGMMMVEELILQAKPATIGDFVRWKALSVVHLQRRLNARGIEIAMRTQPEPQVPSPTSDSSNMQPLSDREERSLMLRVQALDSKVVSLEKMLAATEGALKKEKDKTSSLRPKLDASETIAADRMSQIKILQKRITALETQLAVQHTAPPPFLAPCAPAPFLLPMPVPMIGVEPPICMPTVRALTHKGRRILRSPSLGCDEEMESDSPPRPSLKKERSRRHERSRSPSPSPSRSRSTGRSKRHRANPSDDEEASSLSPRKEKKSSSSRKKSSSSGSSARRQKR